MKVNIHTPRIHANSSIGLFKHPVNSQRLNSSVDKATLVLNQSKQDILTLTRNASSNQISFFDSLVTTYNSKYFHAKDNKENSTIINSIYKLVQNPTKQHIRITDSYRDKLENLREVFALTENHPKKLNFIEQVFSTLSNNDKTYKHNIAINALNSPNSDYYINNFSKIRSYLILNTGNDNAIANMDKMIASNTFKPSNYDKELKTNKIFDKLMLEHTEEFNPKFIIENYSKSGIKLLQTFSQPNFYKLNANISRDNYETLRSIYLTTTPKNLKIRQALLEYFGNSLHYKMDNQKDFLNELNQLYTIINNDKNAKKFVSKTLDDSKTYKTPDVIVNLLENIPSKNLNIFSDNVKNIIQITPKENLIETIKKEITNPFYRTKAAWAKLSDKNKPYVSLQELAQDAITYVKNSVNILRFKISNATNHQTFSAKNLHTKNEKLQKPAQTLTNIESTKQNSISAQVSDIQPIELTKTKIEQAQEAISPQNDTLKQETKNTDKKAILVNNLSEYIQKKLSNKALKTQREQFVNNATKMRYEMLPEIFSSIIDTRKTDKLIGKKSSTASNKDALSLYLKINGNNKKLVNYLLKKRNTDGSRMFDINNILTILTKAEKHIQNEKSSNPQYRAQDVRKYYNHLLDAKIEQYGKVKRSQNQNFVI